ncbi:hypothetical protein BS50DRAFT_637064 [Corynespora cassiicola Philippines]|uniref:Uncharacterized protein n=1 Tax=Corynespora cassiicola Philippines TaxID=1448308 RepID=A0A2T2NE31_CORCC|nr:hypothetical protein BS50DRAFT_637064 [Corynespora cassiicola Philippines]
MATPELEATGAETQPLTSSDRRFPRVNERELSELEQEDEVPNSPPEYREVAPIEEEYREPEPPENDDDPYAPGPSRPSWSRQLQQAQDQAEAQKEDSTPSPSQESSEGESPGRPRARVYNPNAVPGPSSLRRTSTREEAITPGAHIQESLSSYSFGHQNITTQSIPSDDPPSYHVSTLNTRPTWPATGWFLPRMFGNPLLGRRTYHREEQDPADDTIRVAPANERRYQAKIFRFWAGWVPFFQAQSPAELACKYLEPRIALVASSGNKPMVVIDFLSGLDGGPLSIFESIINHQRRRNVQTPLTFYMTDPRPRISRWRHKKTRFMGYMRAPVDPCDPPPEVLSISSPRRLSFSDQQDPADLSTARHRTDRVFRLFSQAFHRLNDDRCRWALRSTMTCSDGLAIIELQERRLKSLMFALLFPFLLLFSGPYVRWTSHVPLSRRKSSSLWSLLLAIAWIPEIYFLVFHNAVMATFQSREFEEVMVLAKEASGASGPIQITSSSDGSEKQCQIGEWNFQWKKVSHTYPGGVMTILTGVRERGRVDSGNIDPDLARDLKMTSSGKGKQRASQWS